MASSMLQVSAPLVFSNPGWGGYAFESFFCWYICTSRCVPLNHVQLQLQVWSNPHSVPSEAGPHFDNFAAARYSCCNISRKFTTVFGRSCPCLVAVFCINQSFGQYAGSVKRSLRCLQWDIGPITVLQDRIPYWVHTWLTYVTSLLSLLLLVSCPTEQIPVFLSSLWICLTSYLEHSCSVSLIVELSNDKFCRFCFISSCRLCAATRSQRWRLDCTFCHPDKIWLNDEHLPCLDGKC